jgi:nucleoside-diphosphate-sugar epimerase
LTDCGSIQPNLNRISITGAGGFIGAALSAQLVVRSVAVRAAVRRLDSVARDNSDIEFVPVGNIGVATDWSSVVANVDCVIHCAARAHVMHETESDALAAYRAVNVAGTRRLAEQAAAAGVRRLVYLSSIKVNGEQTALGAPFLFSDAPAAEDPYGVSKWEAEQALWEVAAKTGLEVVVVRPPLVYGPGVKGNFLRLLRWVARGVPLPLGAVQNQRSLVGLDNLVDLLIRCVVHPAVAGQTFLVSDEQDLSTPELIRLLARAMDKSPRLIPVPVPLLRLAGSMTGKGGEVDRLVGSLQIDSSSIRETLGWNPPVSVEAGMQAMVDDFLRRDSL